MECRPQSRFFSFRLPPHKGNHASSIEPSGAWANTTLTHRSRRSHPVPDYCRPWQEHDGFRRLTCNSCESCESCKSRVSPHLDCSRLPASLWHISEVQDLSDGRSRETGEDASKCCVPPRHASSVSPCPGRLRLSTTYPAYPAPRRKAVRENSWCPRGFSTMSSIQKLL